VASGAIWALPMWAPGQIEGMRVGGVSAEEATEPQSQRLSGCRIITTRKKNRRIACMPACLYVLDSE
jgi:hypothetical protein